MDDKEEKEVSLGDLIDESPSNEVSLGDLLGEKKTQSVSGNSLSANTLPTGSQASNLLGYETPSTLPIGVAAPSTPKIGTSKIGTFESGQKLTDVLPEEARKIKIETLSKKIEEPTTPREYYDKHYLQSDEAAYRKSKESYLKGADEKDLLSAENEHKTLLAIGRKGKDLTELTKALVEDDKGGEIHNYKQSIATLNAFANKADDMAKQLKDNPELQKDAGFVNGLNNVINQFNQKKADLEIAVKDSPTLTTYTKALHELANNQMHAQAAIAANPRLADADLREKAQNALADVLPNTEVAGAIARPIIKAVPSILGFFKTVGDATIFKDYGWVDKYADKAALMADNITADYFPKTSNEKKDLSMKNLLPKTVEMLTDMGIMVGEGVLTGGALGGGQKAMAAGQAFSGALMTTKDLADEARKAGASNSDAAKFGMIAGAIQGSLELINPEAAMFANRAAKESIGDFARYIVGKNLTKAEIAKEFTKRYVAPAIKNTVGENVQEFSQSAAEKVSKIASNGIAGTDFADTDFTKKEIGETAALTTLVSLPFGAFGAITSNEHVENPVYAAAKEPDKYNELLTKMYERGDIDEVRFNQVSELVKEAAKIHNELPDISDANKEKAISAIIGRNTLQREAEATTDPTIKSFKEEKIAELDKQIKSVLGEEKKYVVDGKEMDRDAFTEQLQDDTFVADVANGKVDVSVINDPAIETLVADRINAIQPEPAAPEQNEPIQNEPAPTPTATVSPEPTITAETVTRQAGVVGGDVEAKRIETEAKIKRKDLFSDGGVFANELGGSGVNSVPTNHSERNGIEFVQFSNPNTGIVDVIMTGKSDNDFVGYYRIYENGKATNKWSSKFENQSRNKEDFKTMISGVQEMLPQGHEYTEKTSISTDGLRIWNQQLNRGYELQYDDKGNLITNRVAINGDAINNELGIAVNKGNFENVSVTNNADMKKVKEALLPYLQKFGLNESNIHFENGTVEIDLPVLKSNKAVEELLGKPTKQPKETIPNVEDWSSEQQRIEKDKTLSPEQKEKAKVESTAKALESVDITQAAIQLERISKQNELQKAKDEVLELQKPKALLKSGQEKRERDLKSAEKKVKRIESDIESMTDDDYLSLSNAKSYPKIAAKNISEAYHKAKADNSNPQLVEAVEQLLGKPKEQAEAETVTPQAETIVEENIPTNAEQDSGGRGETTPSLVAQAITAIDEAKRSKKTPYEKAKAIKNAVKDMGEIGQDAMFVDENFDTLTERLSNDEKVDFKRIC